MSHLPVTDWCAPAHADELAQRIRAYWSERGYLDVRVWVEHETTRGGKPTTLAVIRSNIATTTRVIPGNRARPDQPKVVREISGALK